MEIDLRPPHNPESKQQRLARLWNSPFGRLCAALARAEGELLDHPEDERLGLEIDNLRRAIRDYPIR